MGFHIPLLSLISALMNLSLIHISPGRSLGLDGLDTHRDRRSNRRIDFPRYLTRGLAFIRTFAPRWSFLIVRVVYRGYNNANANGGVSNANANNDASNSNTNVGSRLEI